MSAIPPNPPEPGLAPTEDDGGGADDPSRPPAARTRRRATVAILIAAGILATVALATTPWRDGTASSDTEDRFVGPSSLPDERWRTQLDCARDEDAEDTSCLLAVEGDLIVGVEAPSDDVAGRLISFDPDTGEERWSESIGYSPKLAAGDRVVVVQEDDDDQDGAGQIRAFDASTGGELWSKPTTDGNVNIEIEGERVVATYNLGPVTVYDAVTGAEVATRRGAGGQCGPWLATINDLTLFSGPVEGAEFELVDLASGRSTATIPLREVNNLFDVSCSQEVVAIFDGRTVDAYRIPGGERLWSSEVPEAVTVSMLATDDRVVIGLGGRLRAHDAATGDVTWSQEQADEGDEGDDVEDLTLREAGGKLLVEGRRMALRSLDDGELLATADLNGHALAVGRDAAYVRSRTRLSTYSLDDLSRTWSLEVPEHQGLRVDGGRVALLTDDGALVVYR